MSSSIPGRRSRVAREEPPEPTVPPVDTGGGLYPVVYPPQFELPFVPPRRKVETTGIATIQIRRLVKAAEAVIVGVIRRPIFETVYESVSVGAFTHVVRRIKEEVLLKGYAFSGLQLLDAYESLKRELERLKKGEEE